MIKSRHDTAFFQRSYSSGSSHGMTPKHFAKIRAIQQRLAYAGMTSRRMTFFSFLRFKII
ncbi:MULTISPECIES: hypothetical protein [unclassified Rickettsia]|uniref:hypothetical protein n=1 Tax=unclassified Rickettsia TaxID=114295 RepID=UPI003132E23B